MSKASVKKALKALDKEELIETMLELYSLRKEAREYLEFWADPDIDREVELVKGRIQKILYLPQEKPRRKPDFTEMRTVLKNFIGIVAEPDKVCEILVYYPETLLRWLQDRKGIGMASNQKRLYDAIDTADKEIENAGLEDQFGLRLSRLRESADDFYAHRDGISQLGYRRRWFRFR